MRQALKVLDTAVYSVLVFLLIVMLIIGGMQVFWRYFLSSSLSWSEEALRYLYVWATMIGISMGIRRKALAVVSSFTDFIEKKSVLLKNIFVAMNFIIQISLFTVLIFSGWELSMRTMGQVSSSMAFLKMGIVYLALPIGSTLALIYSVDEIFAYLKLHGAKNNQAETL